MVRLNSLVFTALVFLFAPFAKAADLSRDVREGARNPQQGESNYIEVGFGVGIYTSPYYGMPESNAPHKNLFAGTLDVNGYWQYKGFFLEAFSQSLEGFTLGYHWREGDQWSLDWVALQQHQELSKEESNDLKGLKTRYGDYMVGLRATRYLDNYILQLHALTDISGSHDGQVVSAKAAHHWQYKNWNIHAIASASYRTESVANYYFGVEPDDATEKFTPFHAGAGFIQAYEIGVTYPLSQTWVFRGLYRHIELNPSWKGSPLLTSTHGNVVLTSFSYVF